jgi:hypothetical protein
MVTLPLPNWFKSNMEVLIGAFVTWKHSRWRVLLRAALVFVVPVGKVMIFVVDQRPLQTWKHQKPSSAEQRRAEAERHKTDGERHSNGMRFEADGPGEPPGSMGLAGGPTNLR